MRPLLVTGCQRSGTAYTSAVLTVACGWASHERFFNEDHHWDLHPDSVEVSWAAAPHLAGLDDAVVVHLVRHPLAVAGSLLRQGKFTGRNKARSARWAMRQIPEISEGPGGLRRILRYIWYWNRLVEPHAAARWQVETLTADQICHALDLSGREPDPARAEQALHLIPRQVNSSGPPGGLSWSDLPTDAPIAGRVRRMAARYGYQDAQ